jgi:hypothetical protein
MKRERESHVRGARFSKTVVISYPSHTQLGFVSCKCVVCTERVSSDASATGRSNSRDGTKCKRSKAPVGALEDAASHDAPSRSRTPALRPKIASADKPDGISAVVEPRLALKNKAALQPEVSPSSVPPPLKTLAIARHPSKKHTPRRHGSTTNAVKRVNKPAFIDNATTDKVLEFVRTKNVTVLLGLPGTGKTTLANHVAYRMNKLVYTIDDLEYDSKLGNDSPVCLRISSMPIMSNKFLIVAEVVDHWPKSMMDRILTHARSVDKNASPIVLIAEDARNASVKKLMSIASGKKSASGNIALVRLYKKADVGLPRRPCQMNSGFPVAYTDSFKPDLDQCRLLLDPSQKRPRPLGRAHDTDSRIDDPRFTLDVLHWNFLAGYKTCSGKHPWAIEAIHKLERSTAFFSDAVVVTTNSEGSDARPIIEGFGYNEFSAFVNTHVKASTYTIQCFPNLHFLKPGAPGRPKSSTRAAAVELRLRDRSRDVVNFHGRLDGDTRSYRSVDESLYFPIALQKKKSVII